MRGGKREGAGRKPKGEVITVNADGSIDPEIMTNYGDAVSFLLDIVNLQFQKLGVTKIPMSERIKAASELLPYTNQQKPKLVEAKHNHSWADQVRRAEQELAERASATSTSSPNDDSSS